MPTRPQRQSTKSESGDSSSLPNSHFSIPASTLTPKVRFPEFRGQKWVKRPLEDVAPFQRGFDLPSDLVRPGKIPVVYSNGVQKYHDVGMATAPGLVTGRSGTIGKLHFIEDGDYWPHNTSLWVTDFKGNVPRFIYYLYDSIGMGRFASGSGVPTLNRNDVHAFCSPIPESPAEQHRIASCLSSLDDLIAAERQKLDALKDHKQGLMQHLFPREGEPRPRLRFPEFRDAREWDATMLGVLSEVVRGGSPRPIDGFLTTAADGLNWLKIGDVDKEAKYVTRTAEKVRREALSKTRVVSPGDLILSNSMSFGRPYILQIETCIHDGWIAITRIATQADRDFLFYLIASPGSQGYFVDNAAGSGVQNLNADIIKALPVCLPALAEQHRIASCLSSLDDLIATQRDKLEVLKTHKKGLMQQLFPSAEHN